MMKMSLRDEWLHNIWYIHKKAYYLTTQINLFNWLAGSGGYPYANKQINKIE